MLICEESTCEELGARKGLMVCTLLETAKTATYAPVFGQLQARPISFRGRESFRERAIEVVGIRAVFRQFGLSVGDWSFSQARSPDEHRRPWRPPHRCPLTHRCPRIGTL